MEKDVTRKLAAKNNNHEKRSMNLMVKIKEKNQIGGLWAKMHREQLNSRNMILGFDSFLYFRVACCNC